MWACKAVKKARALVEEEDQELALTPIYRAYSRVCMSARYALVEHLLKLRTYEAVRSAAEHVHYMLHFVSGICNGARELLPVLYLRLNRDQEAYNFLKWWGMTRKWSGYDWHDPFLPDPNAGDADAFESARYLYRPWPVPTVLICMALLKIKLLLDLIALRSWGSLDRKLPREIVDMIKRLIPASDIIRGNLEILNCKNHDDRINDVMSQANGLFDEVHYRNSTFWPALVKPGAHLKTDSQFPRTEPPIQQQLRQCFDAWHETPGAVDCVRIRLQSQRVADSPQAIVCTFEEVIHCRKQGKVNGRAKRVPHQGTSQQSSWEAWCQQPGSMRSRVSGTSMSAS